MSFSRTAFFSFMSRMIELTSSGMDGERKKELLMFVGEAVVCDSVTTGVIDSANFSPISVKKIIHYVANSNRIFNCSFVKFKFSGNRFSFRFLTYKFINNFPQYLGVVCISANFFFIVNLLRCFNCSV